MNDDLFKKFFHSHSTKHSDPFVNMHNDFQQMFEEMDRLMSRFHFEQFNLIDGLWFGQ